MTESKRAEMWRERFEIHVSAKEDEIEGLKELLKKLEEQLDKLDDEYQKDIASADGAKRSYKKQRDSSKEENARLKEALYAAWQHCTEDEMDVTADMIRMTLNGEELQWEFEDDVNKARQALDREPK